METDSMRLFAGIAIGVMSLYLTACDGTSKDSDANIGSAIGILYDPITENGAFVIRGAANVYAAGLAGIPIADGFGELPPTFSFVAGLGKILTIVSASGATDCCSSTTPGTLPDGESFSSTDLGGFEDLSGIFHPTSSMFISAVFTNVRNRRNVRPARLDYTGIDTDTTVEFSPEINQVFFVGDGRTSDGSSQSFFVPAAATSVSFGVADGFAFSGVPGLYDDNTGQWQMTIRLD